jgi:hypothetical protein
VATWMVFTLLVLAFAEPSMAIEADSQERTADLVREFHTKASDVRVKLADGDTVEGRITSVEGDSFVLRQRKTRQEITLRYTQVAKIEKKGSPRIAKVGLIIVAVLLVAACAMPYPFSICDTTDPS